MNGDRIDFSALDPTRSAQQHDAAVRRIVTQAWTERRRAMRDGPWGVIIEWRRITLAATTATALAACAILAFVHPSGDASTPTHARDQLAQALGAPASLLASDESRIGRAR